MWFNPSKAFGSLWSGCHPGDKVMTSKTKILLVEDNPGDARLLRETFNEITDMRFQCVWCQTLQEALENLAKDRPDVCLLDLGLPDTQGLATLQSIHKEHPDLPIVVLTVLNDETLALESLRRGAQDYLVKGTIDSSLLWRSLRYAMERQRVQLELLNLTMIDDLTGLHNRRGFLALAEHHVLLAYRTGRPFLMAYIDLDRLKHINDTFGHQEGNRALAEVAEIIRDSFRHSDILARIGGDEFAALMLEAGEESAQTVLQRVNQKLDSCNSMVGRRYDLSFSIGIVPGDSAGLLGVEQLLSDADALMYRHKQSKNVSLKPS
jgi:diguanylate cyclase (GGDEF)-like protein